MPSLNLPAYKADVDRKATAAQQALTALYIDGQPIFVPEQQSQQVARVLAPLQQAVEEAQQHATAAQEEATRLEAQRYADPLSGLSTEELQRLQVARELAQQDIAGLSVPELSSRLLAVAASGDPVLHERLAALDKLVYGAERAKADKAWQQAQVLRKEAGELAFYAADVLAGLDGRNAQATARRQVEYSNFF